MQLGETGVFTKIMTKATKGIGQRDVKGIHKIFIFDSWFSSKKSEESAMDIGTDIIGMV